MRGDVMTDVLVTGGTGHLGSDIVDLLTANGDHVRVLARTPGSKPGVEWIKGDLSTGQGLAAAVHGVRTVVHAATNSPAARRGRIKLIDMLRSPSDVDVEGTRRLLAEAHAARVHHFCHVSIVGVHEARLPYSRRKAAAEDLVRAGGIPWTIAPATGFYWLLARLFDNLPRRRWPMPSNLAMQPGDSAEFAAYVVDCLGSGPAGEIPGFGGPETLTMPEFARQYQAARGVSRRIVALRMPQFALRGAGPQTCPGGQAGKVTWSRWLATQ
jgi:uncharacterized protein YbjT (DUF2867 family)